MRKEVGKAGPRVHLQDQLRQIEPGQTRIDRCAERDEARRFLDLIEALDREVGTGGGPNDRHCRVRGHPVGGLAVCEVEPPRQSTELLVSRRRYANSATNHRPRRLPRRA
jgi:hypothetical protein